MKKIIVLCLCLIASVASAEDKNCVFCAGGNPVNDVLRYQAQQQQLKNMQAEQQLNNVMADRIAQENADWILGKKESGGNAFDTMQRIMIEQIMKNNANGVKTKW